MTQSAVARLEAGGTCPLSPFWNVSLTPSTPPGPSGAFVALCATTTANWPETSAIRGLCAKTLQSADCRGRVTMSPSCQNLRRLQVIPDSDN